MIYNYGLFWKRNLIYWGKGGKGEDLAHLRGTESRSTKKTPTAPVEKTVDFRGQIGVYALYRGFELVYVGQAGTKKKSEEGGMNFYTRLKQHKADFLADRWNRFSWFGIRKVIKKPGSKQVKILGAIAKGAYPQRADILNTLEALVISISEPKLNRQGGTWKPAVEYFQWWSNEEIEDQKKRDMII